MCDSMKSAYSRTKSAVSASPAASMSSAAQISPATLMASVDGEIPGRLLPAFLVRRRPFAHQEPARRPDHGRGSERAERVGLVQPPREHERKRHFVELDAVPVGTAVDPEVLREASIRPLRHRQIDKDAERRRRIAGGEQRQSRTEPDRASRPGGSRPVPRRLCCCPRECSARQSSRRDSSCLRGRAAG